MPLTELLLTQGAEIVYGVTMAGGEGNWLYHASFFLSQITFVYWLLQGMEGKELSLDLYIYKSLGLSGDWKLS